jgi:uncharacterized protein (TIGR03086 family)
MITLAHMSNEVVERTTRLVHSFDERVRAVPADGWSNPAPCEGWTARDVVAHVGNNLFGIAAGLTGGEPRQISTDEDIVSVWDEAREQFLGALPSADLSTNLPGPFGPMPAEQLIGRLIATDVLVHTWDLARAVGGDEQLDAAAVSGAYSGLKPMDDMIRQPGVFGPKVEPPADADEQTEFLCFLGRRV